jgi:aspartate/methionine/tyrosine aminotransferase
MKIQEFGVERWMDMYETKCRYNLAETCVESLTLQQLLEMAGKQDSILAELLPMKLTYGDIEGSPRLRRNVAGLYQRQDESNVLITHGAIGANALVHETLVERGDRVISVLPTYQQHYSIPESYGADVQILPLREENGFLPDLAELEGLINAHTKLIVLNNPNNPTGSLMDEAFLRRVAALAERVGAWVLCDEVYRGIDQDGDGFTASIADVYGRGISTGSMSKSFSLAGLRLGWIVASRELLHAVSIHRDYNTISVGMINDLFSCIALESKQAILDRSRSIVRTNLALVEAWLAQEPKMSWVRPRSGSTVLLKLEFAMSSREFCERLLQETGVLFTPGSAMGVEGYVRLGYANNRTVLSEGLKATSAFLAGLDAA